MGGTNIIWALHATILGVQMSPSRMVLEAARCPLHCGMAHVNGRGAIDRR